MAGSQHVALPSVGVIARRLGTSVHKIEYVIRTRGLQPIGWAGNARVFSETDIAKISSELRRMDQEAEGTAEVCSNA